MHRPFVVCYICGREFGSASIGIHEPKCLEKWHAQNNLLPKNQRRQPPVKPEALGARPVASGSGADSSSPAMYSQGKDMYNEMASKAASGNLAACSKCGRTFAPDRLDVHQRVCKGTKPVTKSRNNNRSERPTTATLSSPIILKNESIADRMEINVSKKKSSAKTTEKFVRSPTVICYICSREFGSKSISIHEPQCLVKWHNENNKLPKSQRRNPPIKPSEKLIKGQNGVTQEMYNEMAWKTSLENRVPCDNCGRRFNPDRLPVHKKSCKPKA